MIEYTDESSLTEHAKARLAKYGSTLDADNLGRLIERIEDYPEVIAAVRALAAEVVRTGGDQVVLAYHRRFDNGQEIPPTDVELTIAGHRYVVTDPEDPPPTCDASEDCRADVHMLCCQSGSAPATREAADD